MMRFGRLVLCALCILGLCVASATGAEGGSDLVLRGDSTCTGCHDENDNPALLAIGKTRHGTKADPRTPTCTSCHGPSEAHIKGGGEGGKRPAPDIRFGPKSTTPAGEQSGACTGCHRSGKLMLWAGSVHDRNEVACSFCHRIHSADDPVRVKVSQPEVCAACHKDIRAMINRPARHPIVEGKVSCSDCHNPHGSAGEHLMVRDSVNETCYLCHMEKRGPFLWEHQPVTDNCGNCHNPHGSTVDNLLLVRMPFLCQECHEPTSHRGNIPGFGVGYGTSAQQLGITQGRSCDNCHTNVHGGSSPTNDSASRSFRR